MFFFFFFDNEKKLKDKQIELHYLSNTISYGKEKNDGNDKGWNNCFICFTFIRIN